LLQFASRVPFRGPCILDLFQQNPNPIRRFGGFWGGFAERALLSTVGWQMSTIFADSNCGLNITKRSCAKTTAISAKVQQARAELSPNNLARDRVLLLSGIALALGFLWGWRSYRTVPVIKIGDARALAGRKPPREPVEEFKCSGCEQVYG
jgi:hypothetical protein